MKNSDNVDEEYIKCNKCGEKNLIGSTVCKKCGNNLLIEEDTKNKNNDVTKEKEDEEKENRTYNISTILIIIVGIIIISKYISTINITNPKIGYEFFGPIPQLLSASLVIQLIIIVTIIALIINHEAHIHRMKKDKEIEELKDRNKKQTQKRKWSFTRITGLIMFIAAAILLCYWLILFLLGVIATLIN